MYTYIYLFTYLLDFSIGNIGKGCQSRDLVWKLKGCREEIKKDQYSLSGEVENDTDLQIILRCVHTLLFHEIKYF